MRNDEQKVRDAELRDEREAAEREAEADREWEEAYQRDLEADKQDNDA